MCPSTEIESVNKRGYNAVNFPPYQKQMGWKETPMKEL